ncbi:hypothetical protein SDJN03_03511, partial [Cucurbita argyrosperma subsp. sororia]
MVCKKGKQFAFQIIQEVSTTKQKQQQQQQQHSTAQHSTAKGLSLHALAFQVTLPIFCNLIPLLSIFPQNAPSPPAKSHSTLIKSTSDELPEMKPPRLNLTSASPERPQSRRKNRPSPVVAFERSPQAVESKKPSVPRHHLVIGIIKNRQVTAATAD